MNDVKMVVLYMEAKIIDQFDIAGYTALTLDRDVPMCRHNTYVIDGVAYKPVPFHAQPITGTIIMNVISIQATGDFCGKMVGFEWR